LSSMTINFGSTTADLQVELPSGGSTSCIIPAVVTSNTTFAFQSVATCQSFIDQYGCTDTFTYTGGSGSVSGNSISVSASGSYTQNCPTPPSGNGTFTVSIAGSR
jgi:hypothetical protein